MAIDDADQSESGQFEDAEDSEPPGDGPAMAGGDSGVAVGRYTWVDFLREHGYESDVAELYPHLESEQEGSERLGLASEEDTELVPPTGEDWEGISFDPVDVLGFHPDDLERIIREDIAPGAKHVHRAYQRHLDPEQTPVTKGIWTWEHFKRLYYYEDDDGERPPTSGGQVVPFDASEYLGFAAEETEEVVSEHGDAAKALASVVDDRTVNVEEEVDEDEFFSTPEGHTTVTNRYDLEKAVPMDKKLHFREEARYWVNKPYAFVVLFHSEKENEKKYYLIEPYLNEIEEELEDFLTGKLRTSIKYNDDEISVEGSEAQRKSVIERETRRLLKRYDLFERRATGDASGGLMQTFRSLLGQDEEHTEATSGGLQGIGVRPEPIILEEDPDTLNEYQVEKLLYRLKRDFIGYERIDGIKHDINVEDISCDGYNSPVFVYHTDHEQIITNVYHGEDELDDFVVKLAQRSGKGISKRRPQVDATLPDGSRSQLTLGREVSDHGTNYTIRQFKDVPFTPVDLINWNTFSLDEMAFLWLCIENHKSLIFAGGTASGKTTSLNAISLFIPSNTKIVSIEDTREVELPQRNWVASVTRPSFSDDAGGDVDEFDLLRAALRQRPDYIVMGEIRGEEGRTLFQVMSTGHTTYTTFHADSVGEVLKRFTTDPINVSKTMFTALDLVSIQTQTRVQGHKVRRNKSLTEINHYDAENDEINVQDVYQWQAETDEFLKMGDSNTLEDIKFDRGWSQQKLEDELFKRRVILAYLVRNGLNSYTKVAATIQAFINDPETILTLIANGQLEESLQELREMESVSITVDPEKEALVPRPDPDAEGMNEATDILERAEESMLEDFRGRELGGMAEALSGVDTTEQSIEPGVAAAGDEDFEFEGTLADDDLSGDAFDIAAEAGFTFGEPDEGAEADAVEEDADLVEEGAGWMTDESPFGFGEDEADDAEADDAEAETSSAEPDAESVPDANDTTPDAGEPDPASAEGGADAERVDDAVPPEEDATEGTDDGMFEPADADEAAADDARTDGPGDVTDDAGEATDDVDTGPEDATRSDDPGTATDDAGATADDASEDADSDDGGGGGMFGGDDAVFGESDGESIFGESDGESIFDESADRDGDDGGSLFDDGDSIFGGSEGDDPDDDDEDSIFGGDDGGDSIFGEDDEEEGEE